MPLQPSSPDVGIAPYWPLATGWENRVWKSVSDVTGFTNNINTMKTYLKTTGPLEVGVASWNDLYGSVADLKANYRGPVSGSDHEVSLVGYYDDSTVPSGGYWVIANSWGNWGDGGYGYVPYGDIEVHNDSAPLLAPFITLVQWPPPLGTAERGHGRKAAQIGAPRMLGRIKRLPQSSPEREDRHG